APPSGSPDPGTQVPEGVPTLGGRYLAVRELGRGGMGRVFAAHDLKLDRDVAIKVLGPGEHDERDLLRFEQEGRAAAALNHPNVLDIHDVGTHQGTPYIVSELLQGETLRQRLEGGSLPPGAAVDFAVQLSRGLAAAHAKSVIHRDLKPENLFITDEGRLKILDFGIAKLLAAGCSDGNPALRTDTGAVVGTADYMAPEQVRGRTVDVRSDIFSFGSILYEMLAGRRAFKGASLVETGYSILNSEPPALAGDVPQELGRIVRRCLEKDPERRYQSTPELAAELESVSRQLMPARPEMRVRNRVALAALVLLAAAALVAVKGGMFPPRPPPAPAAEHKPVTLLIADFKNSTGEAVFDGTLEPILTLALESSAFLNAYKRHDARKIAAQLKPDATGLDEAAARLVAMREGVGVVVSGSIRRKREIYSISVSAMEPLHGKLIVEKVADANSKADVLPAVGELAGIIRGALGDTTPVQPGALETFSAASLEAAHEYAAGQELQHRGDWEGAVSHYTKALELDPDLGRAYAGLAAVNMNLRKREQAEKYFQLAMARIDRMTERERYRTRGLYYLFLRDHEKAADEYRTLVKHFPADVVGFVNLAVAHCYRRDMAAALEAGGRALQIMPGHLLNRSNLAVYALYSGDFEVAAREARTVQEASPSYITPRVVIALSELGSGLPARAIATYQALDSLGKAGATLSAEGLADLALYEGRVSDAAAILERRIAIDTNDNPSAAATELLTLASAQLALGRVPSAVSSVDRAMALSKGDSTSFMAAMLYLQSGHERKARALQADLAERRVREPQAYARIIEGEALLRRGDARAAAQTLRDAHQILDTWIGRFALGRAYLELGAFPEAHEEFELSLKRRGEAAALFVDEVPSYRYLPPLHYYLGRAQESLKSPAAAESYRTFLAIKQTAEAKTDPLIEDARYRLGMH
ncbi:MAG TPA: protein kinase, partial [Myxococcales bacterium]|nr:protein kinase [Myxococcales bacterium]